jgi:hypothetical protein
VPAQRGNRVDGRLQLAFSRTFVYSPTCTCHPLCVQSVPTRRIDGTQFFSFRSQFSRDDFSSWLLVFLKAFYCPTSFLLCIGLLVLFGSSHHVDGFSLCSGFLLASMSSFKGVRSCCDSLEPQCLAFALVLIGNGFALSVWHLRTSRRLFVSPSAYLVVLGHFVWQ